MICPKCGMENNMRPGDACPMCGCRIPPVTSAPGPAWEWRREIGFFPAMFQTIIEVIINPARAFRSMNPVGGIQNPLFFFVLVSVIAVVANSLYQPLLENMMKGMGVPIVDPPIGRILMIPVTIFFGIVAQLVGAFIGAGILHVSAMICGAARRDFEATFRVYCYGMGALMPLNVIPILGGLAIIFWAPVVTCIGIREVHATTTGRAIATVILPALLLLGCCGVGCLAVVALGAAGAGMH
ncbi:MAG TPA: YIP1 family protein [Candidatus Brocadiia bacterium]|nr:YIP1 family protein [Candidatus Brocadiia bacterium]